MSFTVIQGDTIRAYDYKPMLGREDCYVEGEVVDCADTSRGYQAYKIRVTKDVFDGRVEKIGSPNSRVTQIVYVPWKAGYTDYQGRVINLSR